jgi:hypothetical protein
LYIDHCKGLSTSRNTRIGKQIQNKSFHFRGGINGIMNQLVGLRVKCAFVLLLKQMSALPTSVTVLADHRATQCCKSAFDRVSSSVSVLLSSAFTLSDVYAHPRIEEKKIRVVNGNHSCHSRGRLAGQCPVVGPVFITA